MTNEQKYKTPEERIKAFDEFCNRNGCLKKCAALGNRDPRKITMFGCMAYWLALEAEDERPEPCPFCGNKYLAITKDGNNLWSVSCTACLYESLHHMNRDTVIAAHNRVARAVMAAKESEVRDE